LGLGSLIAKKNNFRADLSDFYMSSAFVKEGDYQPLKDVAPNMASLLIFLKRENGYPVRELHTRFSEKHGLEVHEMSDGLGYAINQNQQWQVILD